MLNGTVCHGIRLSVVTRPGVGAIVGYGINKLDLTGEPIPLTIGRAPATLHLSVLHKFGLDSTGRFLMNIASTYSLEVAGPEQTVLTWDYVREPPNEYPPAHMHMYGESEVLRAMFDACGVKPERQTRDLHIPVGGKRYRPALEDIVEFVIRERLVKAHSGWEKKLTKARDAYRRRQLKAAVVADQVAAAEALGDEGWTLQPPATE